MLSSNLREYVGFVNAGAPGGAAVVVIGGIVDDKAKYCFLENMIRYTVLQNLLVEQVQ